MSETRHEATHAGTPLARASDPDTSHEAARDMLKNLGERHRQVMDEVYKCYSDGTRFTALEVATGAARRAGGITDSYRRRVTELEQKGLLADAGEKRCPVSGKRVKAFVLANAEQKHADVIDGEGDAPSTEQNHHEQQTGTNRLHYTVQGYKIEVWRLEDETHPYPWRFDIIDQEGKRHRFFGKPNQCETPGQAYKRAANRVYWMQDGTFDIRYSRGV